MHFHTIQQFLHYCVRIVKLFRRVAVFPILSLFCMCFFLMFGCVFISFCRFHSSPPLSLIIIIVIIIVQQCLVVLFCSFYFVIYIFIIILCTQFGVYKAILCGNQKVFIRMFVSHTFQQISSLRLKQQLLVYCMQTCVSFFGDFFQRFFPILLLLLFHFILLLYIVHNNTVLQRNHIFISIYFLLLLFFLLLFRVGKQIVRFFSRYCQNYTSHEIACTFHIYMYKNIDTTL